ncbi:MAG: DUF58 domain-containing protein [Planctomycetota bacterium]
MPEPLLTEDFLRRLKRLALLAARSRVRREGEHRTRRLRGGFVEFADHRPYAAGDEFRYIDWNLYGRLDALFVKQFARDESLRISLLVDASASMALGDPPKGLVARRIAAAVGAVALFGSNRVLPAVFADGSVREARELDGPAALPALLEFLSSAPAGRRTNLASALPGWLRRHPRSTLLLLVSDLADQEDARGAFKAMLGRGFDVGVIQILSSEDLAPDLVSMRRLRSVETGEEEDAAFGPGASAEYSRLVDEWIADWGRALENAGGRHVVVTNRQPLEEVVLKILRGEGWLK